ncbi:MAG TPA: isoprenylcysteine carboxylmethyltransferase family protein [Flavisolibacter sp.]|nr:isoprenylcysteine carboxylmethyltransferase family protein [Flavisolibacter sp.]
MNSFLNHYLPLFLLVNLVVTFIIPSIKVYKQTGINPVTFGSGDTAHDYIGAVMKFLTGLLIVAVVLSSISSKAYQYLSPISYLHNNWLQYVGLALLHIALGWTVIGQTQMKQSWRIGIDEKNKTALVTKGLFGISRNPVFLGMITSTICIFLILPTALTFFIAATSYIVIHIQIRLEEEHLTRQHGTAYKKYKDAVRRFL